MTVHSHKFNASSSSKAKSSSPFSLRLTFEERAKLEKAAGGVPLGAYIKAMLFDGDLTEIRRRNTNPVKDHAALARVLAALGGSRLSSNLNQLARAVNTDSLPVTSETEKELQNACSEIVALRSELIRALGLESEGP